MIIYNNTGKILLDIPVNDDSYRYRAIMQAKKIELHYSLPGHVEVPTGSYIEFQGERYTLWYPENFEKKGTRIFDYKVIFGGNEEILKKYKYKLLTEKPYKLKFPMTAKPALFLKLLVENLNLYDSGWTVGNCIEATEKLLSFNHENCWTVLGRLAQEFNTEFEVVNKTIHLGKLEKFKDNPVALSYGKGNGFVPGVGRTNLGDNLPVEILYVQGGEKNIDFSSYGSQTLLLPKSQTLEYEGRTYKTDPDGMYVTRADKTLSSRNEDSFDANHIYPSRVGMISKVDTLPGKDSDGKDLTFYNIFDSDIPAELDFANYQIKGQNMTVIFQSGRLTGREFDVKYIHKDRKFEIVPNDQDGHSLPNSDLYPKAGDKYAVFNISLPAAYICDNTSKTGASWDMLKEAVRYLYEHEEQQFTFSGSLDGIWAKKNWLAIGAKLVPGGYVDFSDTQFQPQGILIRITGVRDYINKPHSPELELSNTPVSGFLQDQIGKLEAEEIKNDKRHKETLSYTSRRWRDAIDTQDMLEKAFKNYGKGQAMTWLRTMSVLVGHESLQYRFVNRIPSETNLSVNEIEHFFDYDQSQKVLSTPAGIIQHMTLGIDSLSPSHGTTEYKYWNVSAYTSPYLDDSEAMYLYIRCSKSNQTGSFLLSKEPYDIDSGGYYYFLCGALSAEVDSVRSFATLYGFSEIGPGWMRLNKIINTDGTQYWDMLSKAFRIGDDKNFLSYDQQNGLVLKGCLYQSPSGIVDYPEVDRGAYSDSVVYYPGDKVSYEGDIYKCTVQTTSGTLPTNTRYWKKLISKGADGKPGTNGYNGSDGADGGPGPKGDPGDRGDRGPICPYRGDYNSNTIYYGNSLRTDIVSLKKSDGTRTYYIARTNDEEPTFSGRVPNDNLNNGYWTSFGANFSSVATDLLMARKITAEELLIDDIFAKMVKVGDFTISAGSLQADTSPGKRPAIVFGGAATIGKIIQFAEEWDGMFNRLFVYTLKTEDLRISNSINLPYTINQANGGSLFKGSSSAWPKLGVKIAGGNGIYGYNQDVSGGIGNLYLNNGAASNIKVKICNYEAITSSDIHLKTVFGNFENALEKLENISAFYYTLKEDEDKIMKVGISAQAVKEVLPEAVQLITPDHTDSYYGVDYIQFLTAFGINGLKELHALVKSLTERVNILENKINKKVQDISVDK